MNLINITYSDADHLYDPPLALLHQSLPSIPRSITPLAIFKVLSLFKFDHSNSKTSIEGPELRGAVPGQGGGGGRTEGAAQPWQAGRPREVGDARRCHPLPGIDKINIIYYNIAQLFVNIQ